jgi:hypothetical protein
MGSDGKHVWKNYLLECLGRDGKEILKYTLNKKNGRVRGGLISLREEGKYFD